MINVTKLLKGKKVTVNDVIDQITEEMSVEHCDSEKFSKMATNLEAACRAKSYKRHTLDGKTVFTGILALLQIIIIIRHEQFNNITTKAIQFCTKERL